MSSKAKHLDLYLDEIGAVQVAVDLGAFRGTWSIALTEALDCPPIIYAVEPVNYVDLIGRIEDYENILVVPYGISNVSKGMKFTIDEGHSSMCRGGKGAGYIRCYTWDALVDKYGIEQVDLLKVDIEGAERIIFNTMTKALPTWIEMEYHWGETSKMHTHENCWPKMQDSFKNRWEFVKQLGEHHTYLYKRKF